MIEWSNFLEVVVDLLRRDIRREADPNQNDAIKAPLDQSLFIVAGPGSGKTTAIALRVLKLIFVDGMDPSNILVTTYTRKAASELRSRMLSWGDQLKNVFMNDPFYIHARNRLYRLDLNRIITGTLDSIAEDALASFRTPGTPPPVIIEEFVSNALMTRFGLFNNGRHKNSNLKDYVGNLRGGRWGLDNSEMSSTLIEIRNRFLHDCIDVGRFRNNSDHNGVHVACDAIHDFDSELQSRLLFDFTRLEQQFLDLLRDGTLDKFLQEIKFLLVDEYQDTNLIQEQIYFVMAEAALKKGGSITVVGDDDQSIFRFRGATVDLFQTFTDRIYTKLAVTPKIIYLSQNYRSTRCCPFMALTLYRWTTMCIHDKQDV